MRLKVSAFPESVSVWEGFSQRRHSHAISWWAMVHCIWSSNTIGLLACSGSTALHANKPRMRSAVHCFTRNTTNGTGNSEVV